MADWSDVGTVGATIQEGKHLYSNKEVHKAKFAHEFIQNSGYPLAREAIHLLMDGNVKNIPSLVAADI